VTAETRRTFTALALYGYAVDLIIANRVFPSGRDAFRATWVAAQRRQLDLVRQSFAGLPVREVSYRPEEPIGADALRGIATALYGELPGEDPVDYGAPSELLSVDADGDGYLLRMWLPLVARTSVDAARAGDDLVITVGAHRRVLTLPSGLRRCEVVGGDFVNRELRIRFRPDPALWRRT
jgi:arsenite-transporting ATPase